MSKRTRGNLKHPCLRPHRNHVSESDSFHSKFGITVPERHPSNSVTSRSHKQSSIRVKLEADKSVKKKSDGKRMFNQRKRKPQEMSTSTQRTCKLANQLADNNMHFQPVIAANLYKRASRATFGSISDKVRKNIVVAKKMNSLSCSENSVFQGNGLNAFLKSVKSSINNQFASQDTSSEICNPFTVIHPTSFPKFMRAESPNLVKPKSKKPKIHVMMRGTKRKKKKKPQNKKPDTQNATVTSTRPDVPVTLAPKNEEDKLVPSTQGKTEELGPSISEKRLPFLTSPIQPSKILALSRLNVCNSGACMDGLHPFGSFIAVDLSDYEKRGKKQNRLLYQKFKHRHIIDSVFAADLDSLVTELNGMSICENPADNYVRVRPGEMPLPSIFRVIKIDVNRKMKDRILSSEAYGQDKMKLLKTRKDTPSPHEVSLPVKLASKGGRKKSSEQPVDQREQFSVSNSNDQCLPPKKRHRLVNIEASLSVCPRQSSTDEAALLKKDLKSVTGVRKEAPAKKISGADENKQVPGRLAQLYFGQELTIDTNRESSIRTPLLSPLLSPSPSRLSTRSSSLPSLSTPSPTGSSISRNRHHSRSNFALACAAHTPSSLSSLTDRLSCPDCRLPEQSPSPGRSTLRSLSIQASDSGCSTEHPVSSSEPSPVPKQTSQMAKLQGRTTRKRRKSSNHYVHDSDSSPPMLEKNAALSPVAHQNRSMYSEPPEITCSPLKKYMSTRWQSLNKGSLEMIESPTIPSLSQKKTCSDAPPGKKMCSDISPQRSLKEPSQSESVTKKLSSKPQVSSRSLVLSPSSEYEPLPLEHCKIQKLVEEIHAALASDSDDEECGTDEYRHNSTHEQQPSSAFTSSHLSQSPRKHFQNVGLFSDFYKTAKSRQNSENFVRSRDKLVYIREEHKSGLMPQPLHIGQYYMRQVQDFQLPYDIWWHCIHQQLPKKSERKSKLRAIKASNVPSDGQVNGHKLEIPIYNCTQNQPGSRLWGDGFLNRDVNGSHRMSLFATQDIENGKELGHCNSFDSFSQLSQQDCCCSSSDCRCVVGVKPHHNNGTSKVPEKTVDDCKDKRKPKLMNKKMRDKPLESVAVQPQAKPMTFRERCYARKHRTFLVRNVDKVRNQRSATEDSTCAVKEEINALYCNRMSPVISDVNGRSVKPRLAAYAKDNPELVKRNQLAQIFDKMLTELMSLTDEDGYNLVGPLLSLPSRKQEPQYYQVVRDPIDLSIIKQRVKMGYYDHLSFFNADMMLLFNNVELYCSSSKSDIGQEILKLRQVFNSVKADMASQLDELLGTNTAKMFIDSTLERLDSSCRVHCGPPRPYPRIGTPGTGPAKQEEEMIRCICGVTRDEGLMLQCEKCMIWQHCDCVGASGDEEHYLCDRCAPRYYDPEILIVPQPSDAQPDCTHYLTFVRDDVQYAVGDCVYVMRDCKRTSNGTPLRSSNNPVTSVNPDRLDVFRLHQLWKNSKGARFASGTPYLRPQETFHEPTRKFYHNELFRTPNFEIIPMELVVGKCVVMDPGTFVKGRPKAVREQDIYICEYRVDKTAHLFHKISKIWYPINTSRFCFDWFDTRLSIKRTFLPHKVPDVYKRKAERNVLAVASPPRSEAVKSKEKLDTKIISNLAGRVNIDETIKNDVKLKAEVKVHVNKGSLLKKYNGVPPEHDRKLAQGLCNSKGNEKKQRLDKIVTKLLSNLSGKQKHGLTYLLDEAKRIRKKVIK